VENLTLRINSDTRDLELIGGIIDTTTGADSILQNIRNTLLIYKGEFQKDMDHGTDYDTIFSEAVSDEEVTEIIRDAIFQESFVSEITDINVNRDGRLLAISFNATLYTGETLTSMVVI